LLNSGADPFAVQKLAGHPDVRLTTQTYAHVQAEALRRAAGVLDQFDLGKKEEKETPVNTTAG
jgi:integrase